MTKMGICSFSDGYYTTDFVAPKSDYPDVESFVKACVFEFDYEDGNGNLKYEDKIKAKNVKEGNCRYYPVAPEGCDIEGGCYSFSRPGRGAFAVWYIPIDR